MSKLHMCEEKGAHLPECSCECEYYAFGKINVENALISADQASDTLTLIAGDNIFLYPDLDNNSIRIEARDQGTVYEGGTGIFVEDHSINHTNSINEGTVGSTADTSGYTITVPYVTYDAQGHISDAGNRTHTVPTPPTYSAGTGLTLNGTTFNHSNSITPGTAGSTSDTSGNSISIPYVTYDAQGHVTGKGTRTHTVPDAPSPTTYSAGTGLSLSGTTFNHSNSITAGTAGSSTATLGDTFDIPYVTYDAQGHITGAGNRQHTVTGGGGGGSYSAGTGIDITSDVISRVPLIGEVVCMSSNSAPSYAGTYTLIKKCFEPLYMRNTGITWDTTTVDTPVDRSVIMRMDDRIAINLHFNTIVPPSDTTEHICDIPLSTLGLSGCVTSYTVGHADALDELGMIVAYENGSNLSIEFVDAIPHGGSGTGFWDVQVDLIFSQNLMSNSACNRFYYQRTA